MTERTEETNASPAQLWARYAEPARWPEWDHKAEHVSVHGPLAVGTRGRLKPIGGPAVAFVFTSVTPNVEFTDVSRLPIGRLTFSHSITPTATGCRFTHRVTITGLLTQLYRRVIGRG
ncbi:MAG: SRPBCC family protein, partial [Actinomycetota bacterium]|nr:SRPBCC family protein [Actinomycetota bacterium]